MDEDQPNNAIAPVSAELPAAEWGRRLAAEVAMVLRKFPEADPDDVRLTLIAWQASPLERLNRSLRRGRGFAAFRK